MSIESGAVLLIDSNGNEIAVDHGVATPANTRGALVMGSDGTNSRFLTVDSSGRQVITGAETPGSSVAGKPILMGGTDGSSVRVIKTANDGVVLTNVESWLGSTAPTVGQKTMASSLPVVFASDQSFIPTKITDGTDTVGISTVGSDKALKVDVIQSVGSSGGGTEYTEDVASVANPVGSQLVARRRDTLSTETSADGDVTALNSTGKGELYVKHVDAVSVGTLVGVADTGNSSTTPLLANQTFTGTSFDTLNYPTVTVIVKSNVASATNGLKFQWSGDGTNWDVESGSEVYANAGRGFHVAHRGRYFRITFTNGGTNQTSFRLTVTHRPSTSGVITRPLDDSIDDKNFAQITRSVLSAKTPGGTYVNIQATNSGNLKVANDSVSTPGAAAPTSASLVGGSDGTNLRSFRTDTAGNILSKLTDGTDTVGISTVGSDKALKVDVIQSVGGASNGTIADGVSSTIKATVLDYTNSNPLAVRLTDTNGDYVSGGGGTEYTEDVASVANPVGGQLMARRRDTLSTETSADGDVTALNSTGKGELYVKPNADVVATTTFTTFGQSLQVNLDGLASCAIQIAGTFVGIVVFMGTVDGLNFKSLPADPRSDLTGTEVQDYSFGEGIWVADCTGLKAVYVYTSTWTSGTADVTLRGSHGSTTFATNDFLRQSAILQTISNGNQKTQLVDSTGANFIGQKTMAASIPVVLPSDQMKAAATPVGSSDPALPVVLSPYRGGISGTITVTTSGAQTLEVRGMATVLLEVTSVGPGATTALTASIDGTTYFSIPCYQLPFGEYPIAYKNVSFTATLTRFLVPVSGYRYLRFSAPSSNSITLAYELTSTAAPPSPTSLHPMQWSAEHPYDATSGRPGLAVRSEPTTLFSDSFKGSTVDTTDRWAVTTGTGGAAAQVPGFITLSTPITSNAYAALTSQASFVEVDGGYTILDFYVHWSNVSGCLQFAGFGSSPAGAPTTTTPCRDGAGFEVGTDGQLWVVWYFNGTRTRVKQVMSWGTITPMAFRIVISQTKGAWFYCLSQDQGLGINTPLYATRQVYFDVDATLPVRFVVVNPGSALLSGPSLKVMYGVSVSSSARDNMRLSDGTFPWRRATVSATGALSTSMGAWLGSTAPTVGQKTMANSLPVAIASDQGTLVTRSLSAPTTTISSVASSASSVTILAANSNRRGATIFNDSTQVLYLLLNVGTASSTNFTVRMVANAYYEVPFNYTSTITGIWASANGNARVTEFT